MDKFGIFKLLNSFFPAQDNNSETNSSDKNPSLDALSSLLSSFSGKKSEQSEQPKQSAPPATSAKPTPPLQTKMISVMNSHDEFIKRVKEKHPVK